MSGCVLVQIPPCQLFLLCLPQWVQRWVVPSGSASHRRCPPRGHSQASWHTCRGLWLVSAWGCWFSAAMKRVCRNSAPGGSSCSPSLPSSFSPSSGTSLHMSCSGCRYHPLPDEGPSLVPGPHIHWPFPWPNQGSRMTLVKFLISSQVRHKWNCSKLQINQESFFTDTLQIKETMSLLLKRDYSSNKYRW